ncbi:hypothetical protein L4D00_15050 [Photobacterium swingsii]|uniref:hypothetical protein n=1 Tax=Photobacterium swingsii TaxID=680026 RepID=UPI003D118BB7
MKTTVIATMITSILLVGCGDDKTAEQIKFEQDVKLLSMQQAHQRELARIEASKVAAEHQVSNTYIENEYEQGQQYEQGSTQQSTNQEQPTQSQDDSGNGIGSMLLAGAAGMAAGYMVGEMLDNGMRSYQDDHGNTHYTDKNGKPVSKYDYEQKRKTSKVTQFKEKAKVAGAKVVDKTKSTVSKIKSNEKVQSAVSQTKYQVRKSKVLGKKAIKKAKKKFKR